MKPILFCLAPILILTACTSPLEHCVGEAERDYGGLLAAIETAEGNIARGYAIDRQTVAYRGFTFCSGTGLAGNRLGLGLTTCTEPRYRTVETPVPIDLDEERRKLASMRAAEPAARARRDARIAACTTASRA